eukprot:6483124-Amphidinium_carterae.1
MLCFLVLSVTTTCLWKEFAVRCNDSKCWYKLGKAQLDNGQISEAIDSYLKACFGAAWHVQGAHGRVRSSPFVVCSLLESTFRVPGCLHFGSQKWDIELHNISCWNELH